MNSFFVIPNLIGNPVLLNVGDGFPIESGMTGEKSGMTGTMLYMTGKKSGMLRIKKI
jgi:hypothetical protein